jgi:hypothetical protein
MSRNDQKSRLKKKNNVLLLWIVIGILFLLTACDSTSGNGQSNTAGNSTSNNTGSQQGPDPCSLIKASDVQQLIPGSQFSDPTSTQNSVQGGTESTCRFTDTHGISVILTIGPEEPTWGGIKALQAQSQTGIPEVKGVGDDALYYYGVLEVLQHGYLFQVQVTHSSATSNDTIQQEEKQIAQAALKKW